MLQSLVVILGYVLMASSPPCLCRISSWSGQTLSLHEGTFHLQGATVLEAPFIYSESGPYTGYCVDVLKEISAQVGFNYSLRQTPDGEIGSVQSMNGIYRELAKEYAEFAIGDISRNWLNDDRKAQSAGVLFTKPILTSSLSVLIAKSLLHELGQNKTNQCLRKLSKPTTQANGSTLVHSFRCMEQVTLEDIFDSPQLNRLIIQGSSIHEYFVRKEPTRISDLILVEKSSLYGNALDKLKYNQYVLIDESKFTEYFADQDCVFDLIDGGSRFHNEWSNVKIDETISPPALSRAKFASNEIVIALSASLVQQHKKTAKRNLLVDFDQAIDQLQRSGKLRQLQDKHWRNNCRKSLTNQASVSFAHLFTLIVCMSLSLVLGSYMS